MTVSNGVLDTTTRDFYRSAIVMLQKADIPFLVGGAYALARYTGIVRHTKDFDIFVCRADAPKIIDLFAGQGLRTELTFPHWLGKIYDDDQHFIDVIFSSGNGLATVDEEWFTHAVEGQVFDLPVRLCPAEEMIWSKAFVTERERYDGADIAHLLRARAADLDWPRLVRRFGPHWRLLFVYLLLFGFIYPDERNRVPPVVMEALIGRLASELHGPVAATGVCQGTLLSREQFLIDINQWGYKDGRLSPYGAMSPDEVALWTEAIGQDEPTVKHLVPDSVS